MAKTKYVIALSEEEKTWLQNIIDSPEFAERTRQRAKVLLISDISNKEKRSVPEVAEYVGTSHTTVQKVREAYSTDGVEAAVLRKKRVEEGPRKPSNRTDYSRRAGKLTEENIQKIEALMNAAPPEGHTKWTYRLLADECVKQGIVKKISYTTLALHFKKKKTV